MCVRLDRATTRWLIGSFLLAALIASFVTLADHSLAADMNYGCAEGKIFHYLCAFGERRLLVDLAFVIVLAVAGFIYNERRRID